MLLPTQINELESRQASLATVYRYHDGTKHHFHAFARSLGYLDWASQPRPFRGFGDTPVFPLHPTPGVAADGYAPRRATFDKACELELAAAPLSGPGPRRHAQACAGALSVEALRIFAVVAAGEPVQRKPPSNRGVCDLRRIAGRGRSAGGVPLRGRSSCDRIALRIRRGRVARRVRRTTGHSAGRADVHSLARGVEIRRAGVPLLPARPGSRDRGRVDRRRARRMACRSAAGVVAPCDRGGDRHRSRRGLHRSRTRGTRLHHGDNRRGIGELPPGAL